MEYVKLGNTGLDVSKLCLGCMGFSTVQTSPSGWLLSDEESRAIFKRAIELGINFFDTANIYGLGDSEVFLGRAIKEYASNRDEMVVATKVFNNGVGGRPNFGPGLSRKAIMREIDGSLKRLGMDYVDLYIIHRYDSNTPIEETMSALHDVIKSGKARYIGASSMFAWQFQKAMHAADKNGWTKFVSMQNHYNLIYREDEREMMPLCVDYGVASTPYSPLASGRLSRGIGVATKRAETDQVQKNKYGSTEATDQVIIDRVAEVAEKRGVTRSQVALAWLLQKPPVVSPVIGSTKMAHLEDSVGVLGLSLSCEEMGYLEAAYVPHRMVGPILPKPDWIHGTQDTKR